MRSACVGSSPRRAPGRHVARDRARRRAASRRPTPNVTGSVARHAEQQTLNPSATAPAAPATPIAVPTQRHRQTLADDEREHMARVGAERHADADLVRPLGDAVGDDAVEADRGERRARRRRTRRTPASTCAAARSTCRASAPSSAPANSGRSLSSCVNDRFDRRIRAPPGRPPCARRAPGPRRTPASSAGTPASAFRAVTPFEFHVGDDADDFAPGAVGVSGQPCFNRLPIGSSPGQMRRASDSLTTTTLRRRRRCRVASKARPRDSRMPIVSK